MTVGKHEVGPGRPCFVVAELSCNHGGDYGRATAMVMAAKDAGADAVKLQVDNPDGGITVKSDRPEFVIQWGPWKGRTFYDLYKETYTPWEWVPRLMAQANGLGMECFATPSCIKGVEYLESVGVPAYKVSSFEVTDCRLLEAISATGKPTFVSLGCADGYDNITVRSFFEGKPLVFLDCVSEYPADPASFNLGYGMTGLSDHSLGHHITWAAIAMGAFVVERHFTLSRSLGGPDAGFSLEPEEFAHMVKGIRDIEAARVKKFRPPDRQFCKSVFVARYIKTGETITEADLLVIRPGAGAHPRLLPAIVGKLAKADIPKHSPLLMEMVE
jgi:pseudaminic acid synthase